MASGITPTTLRCTVDAGGRVNIYAGGVLKLSVIDAALATGGALATGAKIGIYDEYTSGIANTREYRDLSAATTDAPPPVIYSDGDLLLTHNAALRESEDGYTYGNVAGFRGKGLKIPPATRNERKTLLAVRARRFNIDDGLVDSGLTDSLTGDLEVTPRVLLLPR